MFNERQLILWKLLTCSFYYFQEEGEIATITKVSLTPPMLMMTLTLSLVWMMMVTREWGRQGLCCTTPPTPPLPPPSPTRAPPPLPPWSVHPLPTHSLPAGNRRFELHVYVFCHILWIKIENNDVLFLLIAHISHCRPWRYVWQENFFCSWTDSLCLLRSLCSVAW